MANILVCELLFTKYIVQVTSAIIDTIIETTVTQYIVIAFFSTFKSINTSGIVVMYINLRKRNPSSKMAEESKCLSESQVKEAKNG